MGRLLLHVLTPGEDAARPRRGAWTPASFARDGFVHLCTRAQLSGVVARFYAGQHVVVLALDEERLGSPVLDEDLYGHGAFPHLRGPLPASAVVARIVLHPGVEGETPVAPRAAR